MKYCLYLSVFIYVFSACRTSKNDYEEAHSQKHISYDNLVWSDEFNQSELDSNRWKLSKSHYWDYSEQQVFTQKTENAFVRDGFLCVQATKSDPNHENLFQSACVSTSTPIKYGKFTIRAKMPFGKGILASISLSNEDDLDFPASGAIEIATVNGAQTTKLISTLRFIDNGGVERRLMDYFIVDGDTADLARNFHNYELIWKENNISFLLDGKVFFKVNKDMFGQNNYPFNTEYYLNFHLAVGGYWAGDPDPQVTSFPQNMQIDFVRYFSTSDKEKSASSQSYFPKLDEYNKLIWKDDFSEDSIDNTYWNFDTGDYWHNNEIQAYTDDSVNAFIEDGKLVLQALKTPSHINTIRDYTSARLTTKSKVFFKYGRVDFLVKTESDKSIWPALWFMPEESVYGSWPKSGEIDLLELFGRDSLAKTSAIHFGKNRNLHRSRGMRYYKKNGFSDGYHLHTLIKEKDNIWWYFDKKPVFHVSRNLLEPYNWPFNEEFYILMNLAVGCQSCGYPDGTVAFPKRMYVDYVKIFEK